jgi:hypothetical protein
MHLYKFSLKIKVFITKTYITNFLMILIQDEVSGGQ